MRKTPLEHALILAIQCIDRVCQEYYTARSKSAVYGFEHGINALRHYNEHQEAKKYLQELLDAETKRRSENN